MKNIRTLFYVILAILYLPFFLFHWNGMFAGTYYWFLYLTEKTDSGWVQFLAALISSALIFGIIILIIETSLRLINRFFVHNDR